MRLEDNMMPVLTGLVFAVVFGVTVQNSDGLMKAFGAPDQAQATDDVFFVRAGTDASLDVLANDGLSDARMADDIQIVTGPSCGEAIPTEQGIAYVNSATCEGPVYFSYCLGQGEACDPASVTMRVRPAPIAVAEALQSSKSGLVPLGEKEVSATHISDATSQDAPLNAYVVSMAPEVMALPISAKSDVSHYLVDVVTADLQKDPVNDLTKLASLRLQDGPLSAVQTARFLKDHTPSVPGQTDLAQPLLDVDAPSSTIGTNALEDEAYQIDLRGSVTEIKTIQG